MSTVKTINKVVDTTESVVTNIDSAVSSSITFIVTFFLTQSKKFLKFLIDKNVVSAGIAIIVGTQIGKITGAFVEYLLSPFINLILAGETASLDDYEIILYGIHFKVGLFIKNLIQFMLNMVMVYYVFQIAQFSTGNFDSFFNQTIAMETISASH